MSNMQMAQEDHPSYNIPEATEKYAGDVLPLRPNSPTVNDYAASRQTINERSMDNIAKNGPKSVDTSNLAVLRPK